MSNDRFPCQLSVALEAYYAGAYLSASNLNGLFADEAEKLLIVARDSAKQGLDDINRVLDSLSRDNNHVD